MPSEENIFLKDATIEDLVEWELGSMDYTSLQDYYITEKKKYYHLNPDGLKDMLNYRKEIDRTDVE